MIRYQKLGRIELNVTDLVRSRRYYEEVVGLQYVGIGAEGEVLLRCDQDHHSLTLHEAGSAGLRCAGDPAVDARERDTSVFASRG